MRSSFAIASLLSVASVASAADFSVKVGSGGGLTFDPTTVTAAVGDTVTFQFQAKNHTATQSTFADPCTRLATGVASGFKPVDASSAQLPTFTVNVTATTPMWFYCGQKSPVNHCAAGMVFAINAPTSGNTFDAFQAAAKASGGSSTGTSASSAASGTAGSSTSATGVPGSSGSATVTGTSPASASTATSTAKANAAMKVGGGAAGALTAMAFLVGLAL